MGLKMCVFRTLLLSSLAAVIISVRSSSSVGTEGGNQGNNLSPTTQFFVSQAEASNVEKNVWPRSRHRHRNRRSVSSELENDEDQVNCQVSKTHLREFQKQLKSVLRAINESNPNPRDTSASAPAPAPTSPAPVEISECQLLMNTVTRTANETWKLISALAQIQNHGERYFQTLKQNHSAEVNITIHAHKMELHKFENELNFSHSQVLKRVEDVTLEIEKALQDQGALDLMSSKRLGMEERFKLICRMHTANVTKSAQESPIPASDSKSDTSSSKPKVNLLNCFLPAQQLRTIQLLADETTRLIIHISKNVFAAKNFKNNSFPNVLTTAACSSLLSHTNKAVQQLKSNRNNIPADLINQNQNRVVQAQKSHDEKLSNLAVILHQNKENLEAKYIEIRRRSQNQLNILDKNLSGIIDTNLSIGDEEIAKYRQLAKNLVECNQTPSAFHTLEQFYLDFKNISQFLSFSELTHNIDLVPGNNDQFENMVFGNIEENATVAAKQINRRFEAVFQNTNRQSPSFLAFQERVRDFLQSCSTASPDGTGTRICNGSISKTLASSFATSQAEPRRVTNEILNDWVDAILERRFMPILNYTQKTSNGADTLANYIPQLINATYAKKGVNFTDNLLEFVAALAMTSAQASAYSQLFELMRENKDIDNNPLISQLAWRVKNELATSNNTEDKAKLESVKLALPESIRRLVFVRTGYVIIESMRHVNYTLYASKFGNIYTYPFYNYAGGKNQKWKVHSIQNGRYFSFENVENGNVLFEAKGKCVKGEGRSLTAHKQQWEIYPFNNGSSVVFRNRETGNYLSGGSLENCRSSRTGKKTRPQMYEKKYSANQEWSIIY